MKDFSSFHEPLIDFMYCRMKYPNNYNFKLRNILSSWNCTVNSEMFFKLFSFQTTPTLDVVFLIIIIKSNSIFRYLQNNPNLLGNIVCLFVCVFCLFVCFFSELLWNMAFAQNAALFTSCSWDEVRRAMPELKLEWGKQRVPSVGWEACRQISEG